MEKCHEDETYEEEEEEEEDEVHAITYNCIMAPNRCTKRFLHLSDTFIALFVVTPLVVGHWYGTWEFMDNHNEYFPPIPTLLFGICYQLLMVLSRHHVHERVKTPPHRRERTFMQKIGRYMFTKLFIYVFSIAGIMVFRAIFLLCDPYGKDNDCVFFSSEIHKFHSTHSGSILFSTFDIISKEFPAFLINCNPRELVWNFFPWILLHF